MITIYNDDKGYKIQSKASEKGTMQVTFTSNGKVKEFDFYGESCELFDENMKSAVRRSGQNPADFKLVRGNYIIRREAVAAMEAEARRIADAIIYETASTYNVDEKMAQAGFESEFAVINKKRGFNGDKY